MEGRAPYKCVGPYLLPRAALDGHLSGCSYPSCMLTRSAPIFYSKIGELTSSNAEAMQLLDRLWVGCSSAAGAVASAPLSVKIFEVEKQLAARYATVDDFSKRPGATASSIVDSFLAERKAFQGVGVGGVNADANADSGGADPPTTTEGTYVFKASSSPAFVAIANQILEADVETTDGKLDAIAAGFTGTSVLGIRVLCEGSRSLASKHNALIKLFDSRRSLPEYFSWVLVSDESGHLPSRLKSYSILGPVGSTGLPSPAGQAFFDKLLKFDLQNMDWLHSPGGLLALKAARDGTHIPQGRVDPRDVYIIPSVVTELGDMVHQILVAMGAAKTSTDKALTFKDWTAKYLEPLWAAKQLLPEHKLAHIEQCHAMFATSLKTAGDKMASAVFCLRPDLHESIPPFFPLNEEPLATVTEWRVNRERALDLMFSHQGLFPTSAPASTSSENPWELPLRSASKPPPGGGGRKRPYGEDSHPPPTKHQERDVEEPESLTATHSWVVPKAELYISGKVWFIRKVAEHLKVKASDVCWPVVLNSRSKEKRLAHCEHLGSKGHESLTSVAHQIKNLDLNALGTVKQLWRYPSRQERKQLVAQIRQAGISSPPPNLQRGGKGRGGRGRVGRGARGGAHFQ